jgi:general stress protein YciG
MTHSGGWVSSSGASSEDYERGREAGEGGGTCRAGRNSFDFEATE